MYFLFVFIYTTETEISKILICSQKHVTVTISLNDFNDGPQSKGYHLRANGYTVLSDVTVRHRNGIVPLLN